MTKLEKAYERAAQLREEVANLKIDKENLRELLQECQMHLHGDNSTIDDLQERIEKELNEQQRTR